jgi:hypothetical protein
MPIKKENVALYGTRKEWREIVERVRLRSGDRCEFSGCGVKNGECGARDDRYGAWHTKDQIENMSGELGRSIFRGYPKIITIVLTTAHLDHDPTNNNLPNLRHWCQMHHLQYDAKHHAETARRTRLKKSLLIQPVLFDEDFI